MTHKHISINRCLVATLALIVILSGCSLRDNSPAQAGASSNTALPLSVEASGYTITLFDAQVGRDQSVLSFRIARDADAKGPELDRFVPPSPGDVDLDGLSIVGSNFGEMQGELSADTHSVESLSMVYRLSGVAEDTQDVAFTFKRLSFSAGSDAPESGVDGPWPFKLNLNDVIKLPSTTVAVDKSAESDAVRLTVNEIVFSNTDATVHYQLFSDYRALDTTGVLLRTESGEIIEPLRSETLGQGQYSVTFPRWDAKQQVTFVLRALLAKIDQPTSLSLSLPSHAAVTTETQVNVPMGHAFRIAGEQLQVSSMTVMVDRFLLRFDNVTPDHAGTALVYYPEGGLGVTLADDAGHTYKLVGANTNFGKSSLTDMWAEGNSLSFEGQPPADGRTLTLTIDHYAKQLRGPWEIELPSQP